MLLLCWKDQTDEQRDHRVYSEHDNRTEEATKEEVASQLISLWELAEGPECVTTRKREKSWHVLGTQVVLCIFYLLRLCK